MKNEHIKVAEFNFLLKDKESKAVLNNDVDALQDFKNKKRFFSALSNRIDRLEQDINNLSAIVQTLKKD